MENFVTLIVILITIVSAISKAVSKNKTTTTAHSVQPPYAPPAAARTAPAPPAPAATQQVSMASMLPPREHHVAQPLVHAHDEPDCEEHDAPGSLGVVSPEGKDACHAEQLTSTRSERVQPQTQPGLSLDWTGENLVKAFVMQEVLTRPCQRQARR